MKIWQRIFIYSMVLFLLTFNITGFVLINHSLNTNLSNEVKIGLNQHYSIYRSIKYTLSSLLSINEFYKPMSEDEINTMMVDYAANFNNQSYFLEILNEKNKTIYSNFIPFEGSKNRKELKQLSEDKRKYIIRDIGDSQYLFISNLHKINGIIYKCTYIKNISFIYNNTQDEYALFLKINIIVSILLAIGMYIISKLITKPINKLVEYTHKVSDGDFTTRVHTKSNDEIGALYSNFNEMIESIQQQMIELKQKEMEKEMFINSFTHEIKTPLTSIIGYSDFLRSTKYNEETTHKCLNYIFEEGKRLEKLSFKLMNLILMDKESLDFQKCDISSIVEKSLSVLSTNINRKDINIVRDVEKCICTVDADLFESLIVNIIDNAIKASPLQSSIYIYVSSKQKNIIQIRDEGFGMDKEAVDKIFVPFFVADKSRSKKNNGFGLGMSICKQIAMLHSASIDISSEIDVGTTVTISFE